jgi:hypothetical protein
MCNNKLLWYHLFNQFYKEWVNKRTRGRLKAATMISCRKTWHRDKIYPVMSRFFNHGQAPIFVVCFGVFEVEYNSKAL